jgi:Cof subfamily protein (haloacid dehalogenase superfamily)
MIGDHSRRRRGDDAGGGASHNGRLLRLIASDLDGTLLRSDRETVSARTRAALKRASDAGIAIVLVSARGPRGVTAIADMLSIDGLAICSNGAIVYDFATSETIRHRQLASEVAVDMIRKLRERLPDVCFGAETGAVIALEPSFKGAWQGWQPPEDTVYGDALDLVATPVTKLIARDAGCSIEELADAAREVAGEAATVSVSGEWVIEILAAGVNKAVALEELADALGVKADEVVAFGDYPNDLPMLAWAGRSIAPVNAHPEVLASVDHITASNDDDGVAIAIEELLAQAETTVPIRVDSGSRS